MTEDSEKLCFELAAEPDECNTFSFRMEKSDVQLLTAEYFTSMTVSA